MRKIQLISLALGVMFSASAWAYDKTAQGIAVTAGSQRVEIQVFNPKAIRVVKTADGQVFTKSSLAVIAEPEQTRFTTSEKGNQVSLTTADMMVTVDKASGAVAFASASGQSLLSEKGEAEFKPRTDAGVKSFSIAQTFSLDPEETIYGLGIRQDGQMSKRGLKQRLVQGNTDDASPVIHSVKGYALFWDNYSVTNFKDDQSGMRLSSENADAIDYYFVYGGNADGVIAQLRWLTGEVPMHPLWTYGFWQSKQRYKTQDEILYALHKYRELQVPLDGIIQDWQYWGDNYHWNSMQFNTDRFPDARSMVEDVHRNHAHMIISIWSSFGPQTTPFAEMKQKNHLLDFWTWPTTCEEGKESSECPSGVRPYDAFSSEARDIYWKYLKNLHDYDMDGWWMDSTEPDHMYGKEEDNNLMTGLGLYRQVRNAFPLLAVGGVYQHQRALNPKKRIFILTRSGFTGQQRYGSNVWSGDLTSSWEALRKQVTAGLNFTLTANPNFNSDVGGFFCGKYNTSYNDLTACHNPAFQELYVRWLQMAVFTPMMRSHGTNAPREIYEFGSKGDPVYEAIEKAIRLRYKLLPYSYSLAWDVSHRQGSFMRALMMDFAADHRTWTIGNEYMYGRSILVAPVLKAQYTPEQPIRAAEMEKWQGEYGTVDFLQSRHDTVYLPAGTLWYDVYTGKPYRGGQDITVATSFSSIPVFIKAGGIVPIGPDVQYSNEKPWDNLELRVYPGADGSFTLYEDEGDGYDYEKGIYTEIPMHWDDATKTLTIDNRQGSYPGMLKSRTFRITAPNGKQKEVKYNGKKLSVKL